MSGEEFQNLYEVTKTVRFGLTQNMSKKLAKDYLSEMIDKSIQNIETLSKKNNISVLTEGLVVERLESIISKSKNQIMLWDSLKHRGDSIIIHEDYYRLLAQKGKFQSFENVEKYNKKEKKNFLVKSPTVKNCYLYLNYLGKDRYNNRKKVIISLWDSNIRRLSDLENQLNYPLDQYLKAIKNTDKAHTKPNLIEFKKLSVSFCHIARLILEPIYSNQIAIEKLDKLPDSTENTKLKEFFGNDNLTSHGLLINEINSILEYYKANGSIVPLGKVSLNYYTAVQKPENYRVEINKLVEELKIKNILEKYKDFDEIELNEILKFDLENKIQNFLSSNSKLTLFEQAQLFKPKAIPFATKNKLVNYLVKEKKYDIEKVNRILDAFGQSVDIANNFEKLVDKGTLNLNSYPIKLAFDYSWENLARNITGLIPDKKFAKSQALEFLQKFDVNPENENFRCYADLLFVSDSLAKLEHEYDKTKKDGLVDDIIYQVGEASKRLSQYKDYKLNLINHLEIIYNSLKYPNNVKKDLKFQTAKKEIGLIRGRIKNNVTKYYTLTKKFKEIAPELGRNFADLREKFKEQDEQNKIAFYGMIVENKYLLALPLAGIDSRNIVESCLKEKQSEGDLSVKKVNSLTSKSLKKIMSSKESYPDFHHEKTSEKSYTKGEKDLKIKNRAKLVYVRSCLISSKMAIEQEWSKKFQWDKDINKCQTYEEIEKVLDLKGYKLETKYISILELKNIIGVKKDKSKCYLLPLISQDYSGNKTDFTGNINNFTTDFENALNEKSEKMNGVDCKYRLHPEVSLFYQFPTEIIEQSKHHAKILNRNSRFQIIGNFGIEIKPELDFSEINRFKSRKDKLSLIRDKGVYANLVKEFNLKISKDYETSDSKRKWIYGFDRGINELATLCVLSKETKEISDFIVFKKTKVDRVKLGRIGEINNIKTPTFTYSGYELKSILDLTNLKVETWHFADNSHPNSVDLKKSLDEIKKDEKNFEIAKKLGYFDKNGNISKSVKILVEYPDNESNTIKLKMNHYQRALSFAINQYRDNVSSGVDEVLKIDTEKEQIEKLFDLGILDNSKIKIEINKHINSFQPILNELKEWKEKKDKPNYLEDFRKKYEEIEDLDTLKKGVVANMVGVTSFLMEKLPGILVLEDTFKYDPQGFRVNNLDMHENNADSFGESEHLVWAGAETYRYFEKMLIRKFEKQFLVPPFADLESLNVETTQLGKNVDKNNKQFGLIYYVDAKFTSQTCPCCFVASSGIRDKTRTRDDIKCKSINCKFDTRLNDSDPLNTTEGGGKGWPFYNPEKVKDLANKFKLIPAKSLLKIKNGDQNAAYIIANKIVKLKIDN